MGRLHDLLTWSRLSSPRAGAFGKSKKRMRGSSRWSVDGYGDAVPVPAFGPRIVCTACVIVGEHARPNWQERAPHESLTGRQWN